jgi:hypothetical protein
MIRRFGWVIVALALLTSTQVASADLIRFFAHLDGPSEAPPNNSPGTGFARVIVDTAAHTLFVEAAFQDLLGTTTMAHIHSATAIPFQGTAGVATQLPTFINFPLGVTSGSFSQTLDLLGLASYNPVFVTANGGTAASAEAALLAGMLEGRAYFNIHTNVFPGGEIRGFLNVVPEPSSLALLGCGAVVIAAGGLRRIVRNRR